VPTYYAAVRLNLRKANFNPNADFGLFEVKIGTPITPAGRPILFFFLRLIVTGRRTGKSRNAAYYDSRIMIA